VTVNRGSLGKAVHIFQLYLGSVDFSSVRDQQHLYKRASKAAGNIANLLKLPESHVWDQLLDEARRLGSIRPIPGQHI
jgi:hypothetical protein